MDHTETRERILQTAISLFSAQGFELTSMADIVAASKLSKGAIYYHFASKEELVQAAFMHCHNAFEEAAMQGVAEEATVPDKLYRRMRNLVCWAVTHREENNVNSRYNAQPMRNNVNNCGYRSSGKHFLAIDALVGEGLEKHQLREMPRLLLSELYYNMCGAVFSYALDNADMIDNEAEWATLRKLFEDALACGSST